MTPLYGVGVDPGARSGAVVLLREDGPTDLRARWSASWAALQRKSGTVLRLTWRLWSQAPERAEYSSTSVLYGALAAALRLAVGGLSGADAMPVSVAVEGLFFDTGSASGAAALHERTGDLLGCLARVGLAADLRPPASQWRPRVLGIPGSTEAAPAEAAAVAWARRARIWEAAPEVGAAEEGALAEAAAIALYGIRAWRSSRRREPEDLVGRVP